MRTTLARPPPTAPLLPHTPCPQMLMALDKQYQLQALLVRGLVAFMDDARQWLHTPLEAGGGGGQVHRLNGGPEVLGSLRLPSMGCYTYSAVVEEYLATITRVAQNHEVRARAHVCVCVCARVCVCVVCLRVCVCVCV